MEKQKNIMHMKYWGKQLCMCGWVIVVHSGKFGLSGSARHCSVGK